MDSSGTHSAGRRPALVTNALRAGAPGPSRWSWRKESNPRPAAYKAAALPLSYASKRQNFILCTTLRRVNRFLGMPASGVRSGPGPAAAEPRRAGRPRPPPRSGTRPARPAGSGPGRRRSAPRAAAAPVPRCPAPGTRPRGGPPPRAPGPPSPSATAPTTQTPPSSGVSSAWTRFPTRATGRYSSAPDAARTTWGGQPGRLVLGHQHPVDAERLGRPEEVPRRSPGPGPGPGPGRGPALPRAPGTGQQVLQLGVLAAARPGPPPPGDGCSRPGSSAPSAAPGCSAPPPAVPAPGCRRGDPGPLLRPAPPRSAAPAPERLQDGVAPGQNQGAVGAPLFRFHLVPVGASSRITPSASSSARSASARRPVASAPGLVPLLRPGCQCGRGARARTPGPAPTDAPSSTAPAPCPRR